MENQQTQQQSNTDYQIASTLEMLKHKFIAIGGVEVSDADIEIITMYLQNIANSKKMDVINQINNLK